jgi:hypothetical protein
MFVALCTLIMMIWAMPAAARTFYVSPGGHNNRSGLSPRGAWRTVDRVNKAHLHPGDVVLFRGGARFGDDILMPGWGTDVSGAQGRPIVFGSYGNGRAWIPRGVWFRGERHLVFQDLTLTGGGVGASGYGITVQRDRIGDMFGSFQFAIMGQGSDWVIRDNTIYNTGDSGIKVEGDHYYISGNTIADTGRDPNVTWGAHGVYLKAWDSSVVGNRIIHFRTEGVSVRYRNSVVENNFISGGPYGIGWHQYDSSSGTSYWIGNTIRNTTVIGIYISPHDIGGYTHEHFVVTRNRIRPARGQTTDLETRNVRRY